VRVVTVGRFRRKNRSKIAFRGLDDALSLMGSQEGCGKFNVLGVRGGFAGLLVEVYGDSGNQMTAVSVGLC